MKEKEANSIIIHKRDLFSPFRMYLERISKIELSFLVYMCQSVCMYVCMYMYVIYMCICVHDA